jgi:ParB-like nuclease domain
LLHREAASVAFEWSDRPVEQRVSAEMSSTPALPIGKRKATWALTRLASLHSTVVKLADLREGGRSPRTTPLDDDHIKALGAIIDFLPPVVVDGSNYTVIDGNHRVMAFLKLGRIEIPAWLFDGDPPEAFLLSVATNNAHGLPLTRRDREDAALAILRDFPDHSDRWIGTTCQLSLPGPACVSWQGKPVYLRLRYTPLAMAPSISRTMTAAPRQLLSCSIDGREKK